MDFFEVVKKRRSIRKFKNVDVEKEKVDKIIESAMYAPSARNRRPVHLIILDDREKIKKLKEIRSGAFSFLESAPLAIVVTVENYDTWESDGAIVATFIQLAATALGLGSCWGHIANRVEDETKRFLGIPEDKKVLCVIGIGYPDEEKSSHTPDEMDESRIHKNSW